jgi:glycogen operon protein
VRRGGAVVPTGDECALTHNGNNNWYGHDKAWTQMQWVLDDNAAGLLEFARGLIQLRRTHPALRRTEFLK